TAEAEIDRVASGTARDRIPAMRGRFSRGRETMDGLGALGFWLMVGMITTATLVYEAIRDRDKERERQATLRALLAKEGTAVTEILAYMRERDAAETAEAARERAKSDATMKRWNRKG